jgi:phage shock protein PspC (stress-responsive transcriptional regulator)
MKKVIHINLGSFPFTIDLDAYEKLDAYFLLLEKHFRNHENPEEIIYDIESRIAELFLENLGENSILTTKDIEEAIKIMGKPEDFDDVETPETVASDSDSENAKHDQYHYRTGRRLFRDPENKVVSGICSGLSAYFGIEDPVWLRIFSVILFFMTGGTLAVVYLIMTMIIPKATTSADRKSMYGEQIDIHTVAESVEEEIGELSNQIQDWAQSFREKRKQRKQRRFRRKRKY